MTADEELAKEVENDFLRRRQERRLLERGWELNMNFVKGKQYCGLDAKGELYEDGKDYFWQEKRVFNHIAPIVDMRLSKLSRIRPALVVRAASGEEKDRKSAALASAILSAVQEDSDVDGVMNAAALWSEICGTAFYKVTWNGGKGETLGMTAEGKTVSAGGAEVTAVSPFEIYPCTLSEESVEGQPSIIHAKALPVEEIYSMYGVELAGRDISEFSLAPDAGNLRSCGDMPQIKGGKRGYETVIERYEKPSAQYPDGRLAAVAGGKLLYKGPLPYKNGENGTRGYPFIKQCAIPLAGSFFGTSVVDRLVPLQRAYNAVKNRKHEFLNRISMGTIAVEDGSVDADELSEDGLMPGKVIVYRQGSKPPEMLTLGTVPSGFDKEEETLANEFLKVSGTGSISENADSYAGVTSATGLQLIIDQDDQRLSVTYTNMKRALKQIGRHILRLYRQFATAPRLLKYSEKGDAYDVIAFKGSDISSDEVMLEADSDLNMTAAQKRTVIYELMEKGLFSDDEGKISLSTKEKLLDLIGYGTLAGNRDLKQLNRDRAAEENSAMLTGGVEIKPYDDHGAHIEEHTAYLLTARAEKQAEARICAHIEEHKKLLNGNKLSEVENG